ncbi:hypothetical protein J7E62_32290 [Variovorax paradoxus]|nr:hypothetical protein [Variovorax paradoxus]
MKITSTQREPEDATLSLRRRTLFAAAPLWAAGVTAAVPLAACAATSPAGTARQTHNRAPQARVTTVANFPPRYFLESMVVRSDESFLITVLNTRELWYVPPPAAGATVEPVRLHTLGQPLLGIEEVERDVFCVISANAYSSQSEAKLHRLDLRGWQPGSPVQPTLAFGFPPATRAPNGMCLLAPGVLLVADSFAGLIWRLDLQGRSPAATVWLEHGSMKHFPGKMKPEQPGVNGVRYAARSHHVYYTATAKKLLMRVPVDPATLRPAGEPEVVVAGRMGDDFILDEDANAIYLTTHRQNTIDLVSMDPGDNSGFTQIVAGDPFDLNVVGPSSGAWSRVQGAAGRVAYFITDGGTASPLPSGFEPAKLLRVELTPWSGPFPGMGS